MSKPTDPPPVVDWAIEHARASLRVGVSVPEIESRLVAGGLDPMIAEAAVTHALSDRIREKTAPYESVVSQNTQRIAAIAIGCGWVLFAFCTGGATSAARILLFVVPIMVFVWFAQRIGARRGNLVRWLVWLGVLLYFLYKLITL
jgi:uncharacterized membrane protein YedE/YeeE